MMHEHKGDEGERDLAKASATRNEGATRQGRHVTTAQRDRGDADEGRRVARGQHDKGDA